MSLDIFLRTDKCSHCGHYDEVFEINFTHNLVPMAKAAGVYEIIWRPDENNILKTKQIIEQLRIGIDRLKSNPESFKRLNPPNKWGTYDSFLVGLEEYLAVCIKLPDANISVSR